MSSPAASTPAVPSERRRRTLGRAALGLAVGIPLTGLVAFIIDLAFTRNPTNNSSWPIHPLVIVVLMGAGLLVPLVLGARAIRTGRGRGEGIAAIMVCLLPELLAIAIVAVVAYSAVTP